MTYKNDSEGDSTYYTSTFSTTVNQKDVNSVTGSETTNFTLKAKSSWSNADLVAICPVSKWDEIFASQVDSVITNPPADSTPDNSFNVPS
jgi:ABC-type branched-subunit amino acid transport system substrate-binding protein